MIYGQNREALEEKRTFPDGAVDRITCCKELKTDALKHTLSGEWPRYRLQPRQGRLRARPQHRAVHRRHRRRARRRGGQPLEGALLLAARQAESRWDVGDQPPEFWNQYKTEFAPGTHVRIHPLLDWTELNIWEYIERENIPDRLALLRPGRRQALSLARLRALHAARSSRTPRNVDDIIAELRTGKFVNIAERSGRAQDKDDGGGLETLRRDGYM